MQRLILGLLLALAPATVSAQLVQSSDLVHEYSFTIPNVQDGNGQPCAYVQGAIAYHPANDSLFLVCHDWNQHVGEFSIPASAGQATVLQAPRSVVDFSLIAPGGGARKIGGLLVDGGTLFLTAYVYYDASYAATASHFVGSIDLSSAAGPVRVGTTLNPGLYAGYLAAIPQAWQATLGGDMLTGQFGIPIVTRTSFGPAGFALDSADVLALQNPTSATPLVYYTDEHDTIGNWNTSGTSFNSSANGTGAVFIPGTASVLFFGDIGTGPFCYGTGAECNDPDRAPKGSHAYPYESRVWAYDANDFAAAASGQVEPWEVVPYAEWTLPNLGPNIGGAAFDAATGRLFVTENYGDGSKPRIHVYTVTGTSPPPPPPPPTDTDGDGVPDDAPDVCPGTPANETADVSGCSPSQLDTDGDGVTDDLDQCPSTPLGTSVDLTGCALVSEPDLTALQQAVDDLEQTVAGLQAVDAQVAAQLAGIATDITDLQGLVAALPTTADVQAVQAAVDALEARVAAWAGSF